MSETDKYVEQAKTAMEAERAAQSKLIEFFNWLTNNPRQHFFHLWNVMGDFNKIEYYAQYAHIQAHGPDLPELLTTIKKLALVAFQEPT